ncbi:hypothetical protein [Zhongshania sp.]|uniref:hypothetical protein n=1 Tax=Zhongshania sp. TaxID=1971902 RepID=UPI003561F9D8
MQPDKDTQYTLNLPLWAVSRVLEGLNELPMKKSLRVAQYIENQVAAQQKAAEAPPPSAGKQEAEQKTEEPPAAGPEGSDE